MAAVGRFVDEQLGADSYDKVDVGGFVVTARDGDPNNRLLDFFLHEMGIPKPPRFRGKAVVVESD